MALTQSDAALGRTPLFANHWPEDSSQSNPEELKLFIVAVTESGTYLLLCVVTYYEYYIIIILNVHLFFFCLNTLTLFYICDHVSMNN